jgi:hypothetical protein
MEDGYAVEEKIIMSGLHIQYSTGSSRCQIYQAANKGKMSIRTITHGLFVVVLATSQAKAFNLVPSSRYSLTKATTTANAFTYGRGAEIWPECNDAPVQLKDSFPNGIIPGVALEALQMQPPPTPLTFKNPMLRMFAQGAQGKSAVDVTPTVIAALLLARGLVRPLDIMMVTTMTGYWIILHRFSQSTRMDGLTPALPGLPPQGHVPDLVLNPLGNSFTNSKSYTQWLKASVVLSLVLPIGIILKQLAGNQLPAARLFAKPLFLLCCQAMSESIAKKTRVCLKSWGVIYTLMFRLTRTFDPPQTPLPIRILIHVLYNAVRLGPLWACTRSPIIGRLGRLVAGANLGYWAMNLFCFLLPIATMRYLRAHFYAVEAEEVKTRSGFEASIGLLP